MLMEVTGRERGLQKLEELADKLDDLPDGKYDQTIYGACALYHHFGEERREEYMFKLMFATPGYKLAEGEFNITREEASELFSGGGCGGAGSNAKEAAAYIRKFVLRARHDAHSSVHV